MIYKILGVLGISSSILLSLYFKKQIKKLQNELSKLKKQKYHKPIGHAVSTYTAKNFTPNQPQRAPNSKAIIVLNEHSLWKLGSLNQLESFSHVWVIFEFHENTNKKPLAKILPPRKKDNQKVEGVFSCRSPHRPNNIGLSLCKLSHVEGNKVHLLGIDIIEGTPILDIKVYIPSHDYPNDPVRMASWVEKTSNLGENDLTVEVIPQIFEKLKGLDLGLYQNPEDLVQVFKETVRWDGRKKYSKQAQSWIVNLSVVDFYCRLEKDKIICYDVVQYIYPKFR